MSNKQEQKRSWEAESDKKNKKKKSDDFLFLSEILQNNKDFYRSLQAGADLRGRVGIFEAREGFMGGIYHPPAIEDLGRGYAPS